MWGICRNDLIVVSGNGFLAYYNGSSWQKLDSGTDLPIQDIWGAIVDNDKIRILCTASEKYNTSEKKLLEVDPITNEVEEFEWPFQDRRIHSVWFNSSHQIWICGAGVFVHKHSIWKEYGEVPLIFTNRIRGLDINDIFVVGDFGLVAHYNGLSWKVYPEVNFALYTSLDFKEDFMMAAGQRNGKGYILKMSR